MLSLRFSLPPSNITLTNRKQYNFHTKYPKVLATSTSSNIINATGEVTLPEGLKHVAVIMDGHRRWAKLNGLTVMQGHHAGEEKMKFLIRLCNQWGVKVLTVFAFSTENWIRPKEEVDFLMKLFLELLSSQENLDEWTRDDTRVSCCIGDKSNFSKSPQEAITLLEEKTKSNSGLHVMIALNYSGRHDILQATKRIATKVNNGLIKVEDIDKSLFEQELETHFAEFFEPDLLIRTSGEQRVSNFLLWQLVYTELYFAKKKFPDMEEADFIEAFMSFQPRNRRYGGSNIQEMKILVKNMHRIASKARHC
ncbi:LOW QUALITY PROTEIN: cis-prenyltransferase 7, chloroplastic-like [Lycium ferocissimum]|uniref:LOW QUALITY PROTEIN: cis-prenyltransferase 7, chloroplastic-like n=1 Tax=Lycium ferocissimum TaxID=112874 RepID=UPI0028157AE0|nr:LOW QUALITY PROTEIN: cis-prenyltransferase 7, chloroplastic-like [Lycium ferocissimum]